MNNEIKKDFLMALTEPDYARVDYFKAKQKESRYSKEVFIKKMLGVSDYYKNRIDAIYYRANPVNPITGKRIDNKIYNLKLALFNETNGELTGHFGINEINQLIGAINEINNKTEGRNTYGDVTTKYDKKKYTFEDWFEGRINNNDVSKLTINNAINLEKGTDEPYLPENESKKIRDYQKQTFHRAVELTVTTEIRIARKKIHEVKNPENWLTLQIKEAEKFIQENPELELNYEENNTESGSITPVEAIRVNEMYERFKKDDEYEGYAGFTVTKNGKGVPHRLTDMYINKLYLDELNRLLNNIRQEKKTDLNIFQKWKEKGTLSEAEQIECVVDIATKKNITQVEAFEMALNQGIYLGRKKKYSSWQKANTRLNKRKK